MPTTIFARKISMSGKFTPDGNRVGVTILQMPETKVVGLRTKEKHGYEAIQVELPKTRGKKSAFREIRDVEGVEVGTEIKLDEVLKVGDLVNVTGTNKGKGFAGSVKRHGFAGGPRTHGQSDRERAPGSSGSTTTPGRVLKGKRRAGHMGTETTTIRILKVLEVDAEKKTITVVGSVPGTNNYTLVTIKKVS